MTLQTLTRADIEKLKSAKHILENPGIAAQLTNVIGSPIEKGIEHLPAGWRDRLVDISRDALTKAADIAVWSIDGSQSLPASDRMHQLAVSATGAAGGAFGLAALAIELPVSTTIMLRSIADIARSEGENLKAPETKLACVGVFALGGPSGSDDATESGYYVARAALGKAVTEAAGYLAKGGTSAATPAVVRFVTQVAARFQIQVTEKAAAQAIPVLGAAGGALINNLFMSHFQNMARGHFTVRRLERAYTPELIEAHYAEL
jgi:hypothetical protein